jgi:hypothetical protein
MPVYAYSFFVYMAIINADSADREVRDYLFIIFNEILCFALDFVKVCSVLKVQLVFVMIKYCRIW